MGDLPVLFAEDEAVARKRAETIGRASIRAIAEELGYNLTSPVSVALIRFEAGKPQAMEIVRELQ
jgi:hypothetical protein